MDCGSSCIKYLLFIFNFIFVLCGLALLIPGVIVQVGVGSMENLEGDISKLGVSSIALIVLGSIIFVVAFFGCCGAIRESHCMIITFAVLLLTILVIQVGISIFAFVTLRQVDRTSIASSYEKSVTDYWKSPGDRSFVDFTQTNFECCGANSAQDYAEGHPGMNGTIPWSCCPVEGENKDSHRPCSPSKVYSQGCTDELYDFFKQSGKLLGGIALGIAAIELVGIIFALCLANSIRNDDRRYRV